MATQLEKDVALLKKYAKKVDVWQKKLKKWIKDDLKPALKKAKIHVRGGGSNPPPPPSWPP